MEYKNVENFVKGTDSIKFVKDGGRWPNYKTINKTLLFSWYKYLCFVEHIWKKIGHTTNNFYSLDYISIYRSGPNLNKLLGAYLGA